MVRRSTVFISFTLSAFLAPAVFADPVWHTVTGDDVHVRCGADSSYYAFTTVTKGSLVLVRGDKFNWARVGATGSNFEDAWGYVKYPASETGRFNVSADGSSGTTMGATPILAPNMNADDLAHSWRQLCILPRGETLTIIETSMVEKDGLHAVPHAVHRVLLPEQAEGWINMADLEPVKTDVVLGEDPVVVELVQEQPIVEAASVDEVKVEVEALVENVEVVSELITPESPIVVGGSSIDSILVDWIQLSQEEALLESLEEELLFESSVEEVVEIELTPLQHLEAAYEGMAIADLEPEELVCLHEEYLQAGELEVDPIRAEFARMRARQIEIYATLLEQNGTISGLVEQIDNSTQAAVDRGLAIANTGDYEVVGRLESSAVFNGADRPRLFRIRDSQTGRTVAYMRPEHMAIASTMLGQYVGIMGLLSYDPTLEVNIVQAARVDLLASNTAYVSVD